ncbi:MAG: integrase [Streptosporangiales bacterium]|nr:integrase [Streptosporangiales bacterium]
MSSSYDVSIWAIDKYEGARKTTYRVRWAVAGRRFQETFDTRKLAESFRSKLLTAAREGVAFDERTGLPEPMARAKFSRSCYELACEYVEMKWPHSSARHRKSIADALATVMPALLSTDRGRPDDKTLRRALYGWAFTKSSKRKDSDPEISGALRWVAQNTLPVSDLEDPTVMRRALDRLATTVNGQSAAPNTIARKRAVFSGMLLYGVEIGLLDRNPSTRVRWKTPKSTEAIDRRVVVNHEQYRRLKSAVRKVYPPLEAFYNCIYYAALRPAECVHLSEADCKLPEEGWGELLLTGSIQTVGEAWSDSGDAKEVRGLKHRARNDTRIVPACPDLVASLRRHIDTFGTGPNGRLFVNRAGRFGRPIAGPYSNPVSTNTQSRVWRKARGQALNPSEAASPLARRPYDLRHACVSTWFNAGVPPTQIAEWAGQSVEVLLRIYAKCISGQTDTALRRIEDALKIDDVSGLDGTA